MVYTQSVDDEYQRILLTHELQVLLCSKLDIGFYS